MFQWKLEMSIKVNMRARKIYQIKIKGKHKM